MKRKMYGAASVAMAAAALAMPSAASAQDIGDSISISCGPGVIGCVQDVITAADRAFTYYMERACYIVSGRECGF